MRQSLDKLQIMSNYSCHAEEVEHRPPPSLLCAKQQPAPVLIKALCWAKLGKPRKEGCLPAPSMEGPLSKEVLFLSGRARAGCVILPEY